jgi:catechol 2,3-dioxygenase-like lactoylglutathione lyase family enzyme
MASGIKGLWHLALRVKDLSRSRAFYEGLFGMAVVWAPDPDNLYLSSGRDNLALHQIPPGELPQYQASQGQLLDHLGIVVDSPETVDRLFQRVEQDGIPIVHRPRRHRDGSYSCYIADPDGNTVQILYEPTISADRAGAKDRDN